MRTPVDVSMSDVTVRGCRVEGFLNSIRITRVGFRSLAAGHELDHRLERVVIEDSELFGSRGVGVFVDGWVTDTTLRRLDVHGAGSTGIYLEAGSQRSTVVDNHVHDNGFRENGPDGQLTTLGGLQFRFWGVGREGLAIDGSADNVVRGNRFEGNANGGIFLYTNCGEYVHERPERWFERRIGAERNLIEGNTFHGGRTGVWIGSRMGENTYPMDCSQEAYASSPLFRVVLDRAAHTTVRDNTFVDVTYGVRVEDDHATVDGNRFEATDDTHHAVVVGTRHRTEVLAQPVTGTVLRGNVADIAGNRHPYRWVHGTAATTVAGNVALGQEVGICEGRPLPATPFIFVLAVALEPPGSPPTPAPDLTYPTVGSLPSCDPPSPPTLVPGSETVAEGDGATVVEVPVTLDAPTVNTVTVEWELVAGGGAFAPATIGTDVLAGSGTVTFAPGATTATIPVTVLGDTAPEADEAVLVRLHHPDDARVGGFWGLGLLAIADDDQPRAVPGSATASEADGTLRVPVVLDRPAPAEVRVSWRTIEVPGLEGQATPGPDYEARSGTVHVAAGETTGWAEVPVVADGVVEAEEVVVVSFHTPVGALLGGAWGLGVGRLADG